MKWLMKFFGFGSEKSKPVASPADQSWNDELFNLCCEREILFFEIDTAKRQKKKSSHLVEALAKNTARRLEIETAHNGKRA